MTPLVKKTFRVYKPDEPTFDCTEGQTIDLVDGTEIEIASNLTVASVQEKPPIPAGRVTDSQAAFCPTS